MPASTQVPWPPSSRTPKRRDPTAWWSSAAPVLDSVYGTGLTPEQRARMYAIIHTYLIDRLMGSPTARLE